MEPTTMPAWSLPAAVVKSCAIVVIGVYMMATWVGLRVGVIRHQREDVASNDAGRCLDVRVQHEMARRVPSSTASVTVQVLSAGFFALMIAVSTSSFRNVRKTIVAHHS